MVPAFEMASVDASFLLKKASERMHFRGKARKALPNGQCAIELRLLILSIIKYLGYEFPSEQIEADFVPLYCTSDAYLRKITS